MTQNLMRQYIEIVEQAQSHKVNLEEDLLLEGFLDKTLQILGSKAQEVVSAVGNSTQALQVIYNILRNPQYRDTATFLLKKKLKRLTPLVAQPKLRQFIESKFPQGRQLGDFLTTVYLVCLANAWIKKRTMATDQAVNELIEQLNSWITKLMDPTGIVAALDGLARALKVSNMVILEPLSLINQKIKSAPQLQVVNQSQKKLQ